MNYVVELTSAGGYLITADGQRYIEQPFDPRKSFVAGAGQPFDDAAAAQAHADALVAQLKANDKAAEEQA